MTEPKLGYFCNTLTTELLAWPKAKRFALCGTDYKSPSEGFPPRTPAPMATARCPSMARWAAEITN